MPEFPPSSSLTRITSPTRLLPLIDNHPIKNGIHFLAICADCWPDLRIIPIGGGEANSIGTRVKWLEGEFPVPSSDRTMVAVRPGGPFQSLAPTNTLSCPLIVAAAMYG